MSAAEYERAISAACQRGDTDTAHELSIGLQQYLEMFAVGAEKALRSDWERDQLRASSLSGETQ